ncbi:RNA polymerase I-specific transcription initiation factor RRN3 [Cryphonectria parasitica EP155]|uniref:RNA polymerase I-specific transcription initiation factor RRN3 n=1 Tax=Cryphonectria parasitica (strain ATCC 38755 / EP155) TaxID=660469 RepID=A0A9P4Y1G6_CRYP1|nr:RNA polymerase I-specific transcription initiation factor RRN3 [Cryphonectria parasitica EP155]KAF3764774.1 RNA polymerase I-specific transcription initiation factor RRN3 [Cryphonectria parasitica EP155]
MATETPVRVQRRSSPAVKSSALKGILRSGPAKLSHRPREGDGEAANPSPESPTKRRKTVVFDMESNTVQSITFQTPDEVKRKAESAKQVVLKALKEHAGGDQEEYDTLKGIFRNERRRGSNTPTSSQAEDDVEPSDLIHYINALKACAPHIGRSCTGLVHEVLSIPWLGRPDDFVTAYIDFLANLVTGQSIYLSNVLAMLVDKFRHSKSSQWAVSDYPEVSCHIMRQRLHCALGQVLQLFPAARRVLLSQINKEFPFSDDSKPVHMAFVQNLLRLREYAPDMGPEIMELITDRLVKIDVQIQVDLDEADDEVAAGVISQLQSSRMDDANEDDGSDAESVASDESDDGHELTEKILKAAQHIQKMDSIMDTLFRVYEPIFADPDSDRARDLFDNMLSEFVNIVLPTYSSRHTQFLIFHFSQLSEDLTDRFAGVLLDIAFGNQNSMVTRQNATAYLASFAARGKKVPAESVQTICTVLIKHIDSYRHRHAGTARPDLRRFTPYYALFQGLLYIFCFRWRDLVLDAPDAVNPDDAASYLGQELVWMQELGPLLTANIWSNFNPLRVCHPTIVHEFAKLAGHLGFMYVHDKIEQNRRIYLSSYVSSSVEALRETASHNPYDESWLQLTPYFPFDPYQLPESRHWVDDDYIPYDSFPGLGGEDEDEDDDDDSEPDETMDMDETFEETFADDTETDEGSSS